MDDLGEEFGERFVRERTDEIDVNGKKVMLRKEISSVYPGCKISISFEGYSTEVEQALCLATTHGSFKLEGQHAKQIILWVGSAPKRLELTITNRVPTDVLIWNAWRRAGGGIDAGLRYAGIVQEPIGELSWRLCCSDGVGDPNFSDLVVRVDLDYAQ